MADKIQQIREKVTKYCIENQGAIPDFDSLSVQDKEHIYELAASIVFTKENIMQGGGFVHAIINNDLESAIGRGDRVAIKGLKLFVLVNRYFKM